MVSYIKVDTPNVLNDYSINIADNLQSSIQDPQNLIKLNLITCQN